MVDFRKSLLVLLVLVFAASFASAQVTTTLACNANAGVPPPVRAEGLAEEIGQITITCNGGQPTLAGQTIPTVNVQLLLSTQVTSKLLSSGGTEALLLIDEPKPAGYVDTTVTPNYTYAQNTVGTQLVAGSVPNLTAVVGRGNGQYQGGYSNGTDVRPNVFVGQYIPAQPNAITWLNIPFDPPGTLNNRVLRLVNVRAKIKGGVALSGSPFVPSSVSAYLSISGTGSLALSQPTLTVAYVQNSLNFRTDTAAAGLLCNAGALSFGIYFDELFGTAFRNQNSKWKGLNTVPSSPNQDVPGTIYNTESMFYSANFVNTVAAGAGEATQGTRLYAKFTNVPVGVNLFVPANNLPGNGQGADNFILKTDGTDGSTVSSSAATSGAGTGFYQVNLDANRTGVAVWEATPTKEIVSGGVVTTAATSGTNPGTISNGGTLTKAVTSPGIGFKVIATWTATSEVEKFVAVAGEYSPLSSKDFPVAYDGTGATAAPRFVDALTFSPVFKITTCKTNLLFPYIAYDPGSNWDTGVAIANTSADIFSTVTQRGTCSLNFFSAGTAVPVQTTGYIEPGTIATFTLGLGGISSNATSVGKLIAPFSGYMIASCNFQYAHAYAYLSNGTTAEGYLALVMDQDMYLSSLGSVFNNTRTGVVSEKLVH